MDCEANRRRLRTDGKNIRQTKEKALLKKIGSDSKKIS
jgi:hypothetical protein